MLIQKSITHPPILLCKRYRYVSIAPFKRYQQRQIQTRAYPFEIESYFVGKSIVLFVLFYTSMNWWFYKKERKDLEDFYKFDDKKNKNKKDL